MDDGALRLELGHGLELELQALRFLKPEVRRRLGHGCFERGFHDAQVALEHVADGGDAFGILGLGLLADARAEAVANVVF